MATKQTDEPTETLEQVLARANAQAEAKCKEAERAAQAITCPTCGHTKHPPIDLDDAAALRSMCKEELVYAIRENKGKALVGSLIKELLDRIDGRPLQQIEQRVTGAVAHIDVTRAASVVLEGIREKLERHRKSQQATTISGNDAVNKNKVVDK
jgi:gamma-glutamyl:cysteine ligase YbdK (ATP-grasp superfamily)